MRVLGLDACRGKWLAIVLRDGRFQEARLAPSAAALATAWPDVAAVGVDIPIGLPHAPLRAADRDAREFVGQRRSSVFPTFPSFILEAPTYEEAKARCLARGWPMPSLQSYGMRHRIFEIASLAATDERIFEVHPEVSFRELLGQPLSSKKTELGTAERRRALKGVDIAVPNLPYPLEDVLDAAIVAWTAMRYANGKAVPLPRGHRIGAIWR